MNTEHDQSKDKRHDSTGRSPMLTVIYKNRKRVSFAYAYLLEAHFSESHEGDRIELNFGFVQLVIDGLRLETIYRNISLHHADELVVLDQANTSPNRGSVQAVEIIRPERET